MRRPISARSERGATFVEYALIVALFSSAVVLTLQVLNDRAGERFEQTGTRIGTPPPLELGPTTTASPVSTTTTVAPTTTTTAPTTTTTLPAAKMSVSCSGRTCTFTATNVGSSTTSWARSTASDNPVKTGGTSYSYTAQSGNRTYTVTLTLQPGSRSVSRTVVCPNKEDCKPT